MQPPNAHVLLRSKFVSPLSSCRAGASAVMPSGPRLLSGSCRQAQPLVHRIGGVCLSHEFSARMDPLPAATAPTAEAPPLSYQKQTLSLMEGKIDITVCVCVCVCVRKRQKHVVNDNACVCVHGYACVSVLVYACM